MKVEHLQNQLKKYEIDAFYISNPLDIYYLVGIELSTGILLVDKKQAALFVDGRYQEVAQSLPIPSFSLEDLEKIMKHYSVIGFDEAKNTFREIRLLKEKGFSFLPLDSFVNKLRMQKSREELQAIKKSAAILQEGFQYLLGHLREGMAELDLEEIFVDFLKTKKATTAFKPIIAFGENSAKPHHRSSTKRLQYGDVVLLDMGASYEHYHSDMTRCFGFGRVHDAVEKIYSLVYEAKKRAITSIAIGKKAMEIDAVAREYLDEQGFGEFFIHSLGHGIGLETHEIPYLRKKNEDVIEENCVITIEPGLYFAKKFGIRIEDMIFVKNSSIENLTPLLDSAKIMII